MLKYNLTENPLTEREDDFTAHVHPAQTITKDDLVDEILKKGTTLTRTDILAVINAQNEATVDLVKRGCSINFDLYNISYSISGTFEGPLDTFDTARHKLHVNITMGTLIRDAVSEIKLEKTATTANLPTILEVRDSVSGTVDTKLTPGGVVEVYGTHIKIEGTNSACGLYFVSETGTAVKAATLVQNKPSTVIAIIPILASGNHHIKLVTQYTGSNLLKTPKECIFQKTLVVG